MIIVPERKVPVILRPGDYTVSFERTTGLTFIHCDIHRTWTPALKRRLMDDFTTLRGLHEEPILALHDPGDAKHEKFLRTFGFHRIGEFAEPETGTRREVYRIN